MQATKTKPPKASKADNASLRMMSVPVTHSASLAGYLDVAHDIGLDVKTMLRRAGLAPHALDDPETPVSLRASCELLEASASASGVEDFGLRLAARRDLSNLGPIGLVAREEPTAMRALDTVCRYLCLISDSLLVSVEPQGEFVILRAYVTLPPTIPTRQAMELTVGMLYRIVAELLGPAWAPAQVCFEHRPPRNSAPYRKFFGVPVTFNAAFDGMTCRARDLNRPLPRGKRDVTGFAVRYLDQALSRRRLPASATARQFIAAMLAGGRCTSQQLAEHLGVDRRTIHRHLASEGESFRALLQSTRLELADRLVTDSDLPLSEVAMMLGFAVPTAFSAWFAKAFGCSPTRWRRNAQDRPA
jgi:AraC-like DNA-binding protein